LALPAKSGHDGDEAARRELSQTLARARILSGDIEEPLAQARAAVEHEDSPANRLDYSLLLMTAQRDEAAIQQLEILGKNAEYAPWLYGCWDSSSFNAAIWRLQWPDSQSCCRRTSTWMTPSITWD
jgi:uncharacterized protein involved in type VI secretion and phage assembly